MVDITNKNPGMLPRPEEIEAAQPTVEPTEPEVTKAFALSNEAAATDEKDRAEKEGERDEATLSVRFLRARRSLNTNALRDQIAARLQSKPQPSVSLFEERSSSGQKGALPQSEREQIKAALAERFSDFAALPVATQNTIADLFIAEPRLPIDSALLFIRFAETASFQRLGASDRQLIIKLLGSLMMSPEFGDLTDGRLLRIITDIANGVIDLRLYRGPTGEPGQGEAAGIALNLSSAEVAAAVAAALKGDASRFGAILVALARAIPDARADDQLWQTLTTRPEFRGLGETQNGVYQALKQFPKADPARLIEYAAYPSRNFAAQPAYDCSNELKLIAAIDTNGSIDVERVVQGEIPIGLYRASDGKKSLMEKEAIKLNLADPSVQRSLGTDGKLVAAAIARLSAAAAGELDKKVAELDINYGFKKLDPATKRLIVGALNEYPEADLGDLVRFAESRSFAEMISKGGRERAHAMRFIASILHQVAGDPKRLMLVYHSLHRLFNNDIQFLGFLHETGYAGTCEGGGVSINSKWLEDDMESMATLVTEVNHALHERPDMDWGGTIAIFAGEYRAAYTDELFRTNEPPKAEHMRQVMNGLLNAQPSSVYAHLRHTYETDPAFAQLVDWVNEKLDDDRVPTPEELRQVLLNMVGKTPNIASAEYYEEPWIIDNQSPFPDAAAVVARLSQQIAFDTLAPDEQAVVVNLVRKYNAEPEAFHRFMQTPGFQQAGESERRWALRALGGLSAAAAKAGAGSAASRALAQVASGRVGLNFYEAENDARIHYMEEQILHINVHECRKALMDDWISGLNDTAIDAILAQR